MKTRSVSVALVCALLMAVAVTAAFAETGKKDQPPPKAVPAPDPAATKVYDTKMDDRQLKGHLFLRPFNYPLAIPTTNIGVGLGYAYGQTKFDEKIDFLFFKEDTFNVGGLAESIDFEIEFLNRFSFEFLLNGRAVAGADDHTALVYGGQALYTAALTPKVTIVQSNDWGSALAIGADLIWDQGAQSSPIILFQRMLTNVLDMLNDVTTTGELPTENDIKKLTRIKLSEAIITQTTTSVRPMLLFAQTIHPAVGIQVSAGYNYGFDETVDAPKELNLEAGDPPSSISGGGTLTFDFGRLSDFRMGVKIDGNYEQETDDGDKSDTIVIGGGPMYTGRRNLDLGATFYYMTSKAEDVTTDNYMLFLNMAYFF